MSGVAGCDSELKGFIFLAICKYLRYVGAQFIPFIGFVDLDRHGAGFLCGSRR
jgi:hypothetical protein